VRGCARLKSSGRGAAWLARLLGVQEVPGSNPGGPTNKSFRINSPFLQFCSDLGRPCEKCE
jgi:hypothetical protein